MSNPLIHAFFLGRATAEVFYEAVEQTLTETVSNAGKFDAEQRERLRQFTSQVMERAQAAEATAGTGEATTVHQPADLQETIDDLRAEIAQLRSALQKYRSHSE
ncbi:hypothetical protein C1752_03298 [Acaryochloris thomasi RCC1774]|uniref:Thylakoid lumen protein n=1 Tax=Acaryochloris thomasi RCC1774 TaxID=1764569 RepID=A0A2W1JPR8_9CYAN|nr:hypothetical protein [Acaryochloris thomasi]PZD72882.1 hypothetical protein C1752_03298 [Acaryochloris thomasi RCC1774]